MFRLKDKNEKWGWFKDSGTDGEVCYENGDCVPFSTSLVEFSHGKYQGETLSECNDIGYLNWISRVKADDYFTQYCIHKRLSEI